MESKAYEYMDWPRIQAVVYGEEASPKDVMAPRLTTDGVLIQGFFPEADKTEVLVGSRKYEMEQEDEAGYFAADEKAEGNEEAFPCASGPLTVRQR